MADCECSRDAGTLPCEKGKETLKPGQIQEYPIYFFRNIDWTITERCNYNCLHCFHAADNERHREEFSKEEAFRMLEETARCGISGIRLTGDEPTLYPHFREIVKEIRTQGLTLATLITNGALLDEDLIRFVKDIHPNVQIMLSFDGIGTHDWLRQQKGSEEQVCKTIILCKNAGLNVKINMNVNRRNRGVVFDSVKMLAELGVNEIRLIKTTEAPRWQLNAANESLSICEYYDLSAAFAKQHKDSGMKLPVTIWQAFI
ncbi:MAG: radical SAM protein [Parasporobacterium sp.]|nr:radical SAM protein [Parasporobacterium sp.]